MKPDKTLTTLAGMIALEVPIKQPQHTTDAKVSWKLIDRIRARMTELGLDWEAMALGVKARHEELRKGMVRK